MKIHTYLQLALALVILLLKLTAARADQGQDDQWTFSATVGAVAWKDLAELEPAAGGNFDSVGFVIELAAYERAGRWRDHDVFGGVELGLFTTSSDVPAFVNDYSQRGLYLTASVRLRLRETEQGYFDVQSGAGWYQVDVVDLDCDSGCLVFSEAEDKSALGGYVGISAGFGKHFIADLKVHFADFGDMAGLGNDAGSLSGPIIISSIGARF